MYLANGCVGEGFIDGDGRLQAEKLIAQIESNSEHYQRKVKSMREQMAKIDSIIDSYKALEAAKEEFNNNIDSSIREYFGLKV